MFFLIHGPPVFSIPGYFRTVDGDQASLLTLFKVRNVTLRGEGNATLRMRRADYHNASMGYTERSEWRHGIHLWHVQGVGVHGLRVVSDRPCNVRREGGQSLVIGGSSLVILEGKACNPL